MPNRSYLRAIGQFLGDLFQGKDRRAIDNLTKALGHAEAARVAKQAGMRSRFLPSKPVEEPKRGQKERVAGEDGDLLFANGSSNVHSVTYYVEARQLQVRFLGGDGQHRAGPGPNYAYYNVPYEVWQRFKAAHSKGKAVWDLLRVRGTVFAHQYDYALIGAGAGGTVPRKQTGVGLNPRELKQGGKVYKSNKPGTGQFGGKL